MVRASPEKWIRRTVLASLVVVLVILWVAHLQEQKLATAAREATAVPSTPNGGQGQSAGQNQSAANGASAKPVSPLALESPGAISSDADGQSVAVAANTDASQSLLQLCDDSADPELCQQHLRDWAQSASEDDVQMLRDAVEQVRALAQQDAVPTGEAPAFAQDLLGAERYEATFGKAQADAALTSQMDDFVRADKSQWTEEERSSRLEQLSQLTEQAKSRGLTESEATLLQLKLIQSAARSDQEFVEQAIQFYQDKLNLDAESQ